SRLETEAHAAHDAMGAIRVLEIANGDGSGHGVSVAGGACTRHDPPQPYNSAMHRHRSGLALFASILALLAALPILAIVARGFSLGGGPTWAHLAATVLPEFVVNTLLLIALVGLGAGAGGTITGWLVARYQFPGRAFFEWALLLPLAMPAYVSAYAYTDF